MQLIKPSFEIINQEPGFEGVLKQIEKAGRTCYKSEDRISEGSAKKFVDMLTTNCHGAMLEHGTVYLSMSTGLIDAILHSDLVGKYMNNKYSVCVPYVEYENDEDIVGISKIAVTTNYRVLVENGWLDDLKYQCEPTKYHEKRITVKITCDRGVTHEFVRHRVFSFAQESTRYCNYSKGKFGEELVFIKPIWLDSEILESYGPYHTVARSNTPESIYIANLNNAERDYMDLINMGWKPQEARAILPNSLKAELVMTGFTSDWKHFFELRCDSGAHPQAKEIAIPLQQVFIDNNYI